MRHIATKHQYIVWIALFAGMSLLPWIAIPLDILWGTAKAMGRTLNMGVIFSFLFIATLASSLKILREPQERIIMIFVVVLVGYGSIHINGSRFDIILSYAGLISILSATAAAMSARAIIKSGFDLQPHFLKYVTLGVIPVVFLPLLVYLFSDQHAAGTWYLNVFGMGNVRAVGVFSAIGIISLAPMVAIHGFRKSTIVAVLMVFLWATLSWSGSRGALMAILPAIVVSVLLGQGKLKTLLYNAAWFCIGILTSLLYFIPGGSFGLIPRAHKVISGTSEQTLNRVSSGRIDLWEWSIGRILEKPWGGWGYGSMKPIPGAPNFYHTHNIILKSALGFGIPLTLLLLATITVLTYRAFRSYIVNPTWEGQICIGLITLLPLHSMFSGVLINPYPLTVYLCAMTILLTSKRARNPEPKSSPKTSEKILFIE